MMTDDQMVQYLLGHKKYYWSIEMPGEVETSKEFETRREAREDLVAELLTFCREFITVPGGQEEIEAIFMGIKILMNGDQSVTLVGLDWKCGVYFK